MVAILGAVLALTHADLLPKPAAQAETARLGNPAVPVYAEHAIAHNKIMVIDGGK